MIIPNIWENKIHVPNHQPDVHTNYLFYLMKFLSKWCPTAVFVGTLDISRKYTEIPSEIATSQLGPPRRCSYLSHHVPMGFWAQLYRLSFCCLSFSQNCCCPVALGCQDEELRRAAPALMLRTSLEIPWKFVTQLVVPQAPSAPKSDANVGLTLCGSCNNSYWLVVDKTL